MQVDPTFASIQYFMQDGALPHYTLIVSEYLDRHFGHWICRHGFVEWPARLGDLTLCDFFLWGALKDCDFAKKPRSILQLMVSIEEEFYSFCEQKDILLRTCRTVATHWDHA